MSRSADSPVVERGSVGIVETQYYTFAEPPNELVLDCGKKLGPITVAYEVCGTMNADKSNVVLVVHALSADAHVAGRHSPDDRKGGWWEDMVGPGKGIDTTKYCVVCANVIGGCKGSTGPSSINPITGKPFGLDFPMITIRDMVRVEKALIDHLGIDKLLCVVGGSMGGMQVLEWTVTFPDRTRSAIALATTSRLSAQGIAFNEVGRQAIMADPNWKGGNYYNTPNIPSAGLAIARMIGHITYLSDESMRQKFGRRLQDKLEPDFDFDVEFEVESYLRYQGDSFVRRFDANSYLYITRAMDYFDLSQRAGSLEAAFKPVRARYLVVSYTSDWLFPTAQSKEIVRALKKNNVHVTFCEIDADYGHDTFLLPSEDLSRLIANFLHRAREHEI